MDNAVEKGKHTIVDCGYVGHANARNNADRLREAMGLIGKHRNCVAVVACGRVLVRVPNSKRGVLKRFANIKKPGKYAWTTHAYDAKGPQFGLKYALK